MDLKRLFKRRKKYLGPPFYEGKPIEEYEDIWGNRTEKAISIGIEIDEMLRRATLFIEEVRLEQTQPHNYEIFMHKKAKAQKKKEREKIKDHLEQYVSEEEANTPASDLKEIERLRVELSEAEDTKRSLEKLCSTLKIDTNDE